MRITNRQYLDGLTYAGQDGADVESGGAVSGDSGGRGEAAAGPARGHGGAAESLERGDDEEAVAVRYGSNGSSRGNK